MSKTVNILEVLEKAQQSPASVSKRNKQSIIDAYGRALTMQKVLADFIKVNRQLMIDLSMSENATYYMGGITHFMSHKNWVQRLTRYLLKKNLARLRIINAKCQRNINKYKLCLYRKQQFHETKKQRLMR